LANVVGSSEVVVDDDTDLLMSEKEQLSIEDLVELDKEGREEAEEEGTEEVDWVLAHNQKLSDALQIIDKSLTIFHREDPNTERSSKVKRDVLTSVRCYLKILKER
jgi:hypothetical protein